MPRELPLQRSAYSASPSCAMREGLLIHRCCSSRYELVVEDLAELPFGEIRGGVESCVQVLQTGREQRYVKHLGLCQLSKPRGSEAARALVATNPSWWVSK